MNNILRSLNLTFSLFITALLSGCTTTSGILHAPTTTAMYTQPKLIGPNENIYLFTIAVGGELEAYVADQRLELEVEKFMAKKGFSRYEILSRHRGLLFSRFTYSVKFFR